MFTIEQIKSNKKEYLPLLLLADPCEEMIDLYLDKGEMYVLNDENKILCEAVVIEISNTECELKNIATTEEHQMKGYAKRIIDHISNIYKKNYKEMFVGTTSAAVPFYNKLGFQYSHTVKNFFVDNYPKSIFEGNAQCADMLYLKKDL
ncbi:N-acetyltransferase [Clostridium gelidum]|uniref:N-acetyltransferase n=1 Tax=Clostridium gelidum TaxID=704125 RepID=A0ABN6J4P5_9CLOT|nr:GNAT family N-acetyltransferase [Clostridium gelidum]BCZ47747.1 N-acetyltransferase [Clostridium gelidum]